VVHNNHSVNERNDVGGDGFGIGVEWDAAVVVSVSVRSNSLGLM
jgi:hypothetical protein